jgi:hypothetical protein
MTGDIKEIAETLHGKESGEGYLCQCPAHDDARASLSVSKPNGKILVRCHAGCSQDASPNHRQCRFIEEYLRDLSSAARAYQRAGYQALGEMHGLLPRGPGTRGSSSSARRRY